MIDNGSTDRTPALLGDYSDRLPNLRVIQEPKRGLSNARNTGWRTARGAYVGYLDDDAIPPPNWVEVALDVIADPAPEAFGGPYSNYYTSPKPEWFKDHYQTMDCGNAARALDPGVVSLLAGLNLFFRRDVLARLGGFNPALGMNGTAVAYGEETLLLQQISRAGGVVWYEPCLGVRHLCPPRKFDVLWWLQSGFSMGRDHRTIFRILEPDVPVRPWIRVCTIVLRVCATIFVTGTIGCLFRNRNYYPAWQNYYCEYLRGHFVRLGTNVAALRERLHAIENERAE